jgi:hypothetical protein
MTDRLDDNKAPISPFIVGSAGFILACAFLPLAFGILGEIGVLKARPGDFGAEAAFWAIAIICGAVPAYIQQGRWLRWCDRQ